MTERAKQGTRYLIVNADDFGVSPGINRGIVQAHERGIVTSASLMVRYDAAREAAAYGRAHPDLSLGLHVDLAEWTYKDGEWIPLYEVVTVDDAEQVSAELSRQLGDFRRLTGANPSHLDAHQHVHRHEPLRSILRELAASLDVPLRHYAPGIHYVGDFYGQTARGEPYLEAISADGLVRTLAALQPGMSELACHPGLDQDIETLYDMQRAIEVQTLCDPGVRTALLAMEIRLISFNDLLAGPSQSDGDDH